MKHDEAIEAAYRIECRPVVVEDEPDAHNVFLVIEAQQFCVTKYALENLTEAKHMAGMLDCAMRRAIATFLRAWEPDPSVCGWHLAKEFFRDTADELEGK